MRPNRRINAVAVTGGLGFIGSNLVAYLLRHPGLERIVIVDSRVRCGSFLSERLIPRSRRVEIHEVDLCEERQLEHAAQGCELIFHLAAQSHVQRSILDPKEFVRSNVEGTCCVLEVARRSGSRVVLASTSEVYGNVESGRLSEGSPLDAWSPYAATKLAADRLVLAYTRTYGVDGTILRLFNTYGPGQLFEKVVPMFLCSALCGLPLPVQGDGAATRDWIYVEDVCNVMIELLDRSYPGEVFNVASGQEVSVAEIARKVAELVGCPQLYLDFFPERLGHVRRQVADADKMVAVLGAAKTTFSIGLEKTFRWYQKHIDIWRPLFLTSRPALLEELGDYNVDAVANAT